MVSVGAKAADSWVTALSLPILTLLMCAVLTLQAPASNSAPSIGTRLPFMIRIQFSLLVVDSNRSGKTRHAQRWLAREQRGSELISVDWGEAGDDYLFSL